MTNRRDHYDDNGKYTGHSEDSRSDPPKDDAYWAEFRETGFAPGSSGSHSFPALSPSFQNREAIAKAKLETRRKNYILHRRVAVAGSLAALVMLILGIAGVGNGFTWTVFVLSSIAGCIGGWELIDPDIE